jgi:hypothetical protein
MHALTNTKSASFLEKRLTLKNLRVSLSIRFYSLSADPKSQMVGNRRFVPGNIAFDG